MAAGAEHRATRFGSCTTLTSKCCGAPRSGSWPVILESVFPDTAHPVVSKIRLKPCDAKLPLQSGPEPDAVFSPMIVFAILTVPLAMEIPPPLLWIEWLPSIVSEPILPFPCARIASAILTAAITEERIVEQVERGLGCDSAAVTLIRVVADDRAVDDAQFARRHREDTAAVVPRGVVFDDAVGDRQGPDVDSIPPPFEVGAALSDRTTALMNTFPPLQR